MFAVAKFRPILCWLALPLLGLASAACNDNPTTIGADYLPENVELRSYTLRPEDFEITSGLAISSNSTPEGGEGVLVGRSPDGITAHGLLAITTENPILSGSAAKPVKSATLKFRTGHYRYGDTSTRAASFDVVVLNDVFSSTDKWSPDLVTRIEAGSVLGTFSGTYDNDTTLAVSLDPTATQTFLQEYFRYDSANGTREFKTLKTLALRARSDGRIITRLNGISGISEAYRPSLSVTVVDGTADDSTVSLAVGSTNWITDAVPNAGPSRIVVQGGPAARTLLRLRLDSIPNTAVIHSAELRLTLDPANCAVGTMGITNYLVAYLGVDSSLQNSFYLRSSVAGVFPVNRMTQADTSAFTDVYRFTTLGPAVGSWLRHQRGLDHTYNNNGVILALNRGSSGTNLETTTVDRLTFFGTNAADASKRPSLTIYYSLQSDAK